MSLGPGWIRFSCMSGVDSRPTLVESGQDVVSIKSSFFARMAIDLLIPRIALL